MRLFRSIRAIALLEAAKGVLIFSAGMGALSLMHHDVQRLADQLISHLHLNPANRHPGIFIEIAAQTTDDRLWLLGVSAAAYGTVLIVEAYGLWRSRRWAEWLAAVIGSLYIPIEVHELLQSANWFTFSTLLVNLFIVGLMVKDLLRAPLVEKRYAVSASVWE